MLTETLGTLAALAMMTEFLTEMIKDNIPYADRIPGKWIAAALGILICVLTDKGLLTIVGGYSRVPYLDYFITGLIISRGSGVIHELIDSIIGFSRRLSKGPNELKSGL
jgi:hypothetical protein